MKKRHVVKIDSVEQYESMCEVFNFLDTLGLKEAWKANRYVVRVHSEYWERCYHCDEPHGTHDEPCLDEDGGIRRNYNEDSMER